MPKLKVSSAQALEILDECAASVGLKIPKAVTAQAAQLGDFSTFKSFREQFYSPVNRQLSQTEHGMPPDFREMVMDPLRLKVAILLGLNDDVRKESESEPSKREILLQFLSELDEGEAWGPTKLRKWRSNTKEGYMLHERLYRIAGVNRMVIEQILGDDADELLTRNPFEKEMRLRLTISSVQKYLVEFIEQLPEGDSWAVKDLRNWTASDGVKGRSIYKWIRRHLKHDQNKVLTNEMLQEILGKSTDTLAQRNPLETREYVYLKTDDVERYLAEFMTTLRDGQSWSAVDLVNWISEDGVRGKCVYEWLWRHVRHQDKIDWLYVLLKLITADDFNNHPFEYYGKKYLSNKQSFTTAAPDIDEQNFGRGIKDPQAKTPEQILIEKEQQQRISADIQQLKEAFSKLSADKQLLAQRYYNDEDLSPEEFASLSIAIIEKMPHDFRMAA